MAKRLVTIVGSLTLCFAGYAKSAETPAWRLSDMSPNLIESSFGSNDADCIDQECTFQLYYFTGNNYVKDPKRQSLLFIPGGPGEIVDPRNADLSTLEKDFNVVYFDIRGTGNSRIPLSKLHDRYLRAKYIVADIERVREHLGIKSWDGVYAHSWGTIIAQLYAAESERRQRGGSDKIVKRLVLSAPVARGTEITERDRTERIVANLREIYTQNSSSYEGCSGKYEQLLNERQVAVAEQIKALQKGDFDRFRALQEKIAGLEEAIVGDLCVVKPIVKEAVLTSLSKKLADLEHFGSFNLVAEHYENPDVNLPKDSEFMNLFPYPKSFYRALSILQQYGGEETPRSDVANPGRTLKTRAALNLSHYLTANSMTCGPGTTPFLNEVSVELQAIFCAQINFVNWLQSGDRELGMSSRGRTVFGIHDGLSRWIFMIMSRADRLDQSGCFTGADLRDLADGKLKVHRIFAVEASKLAPQAADRICPWQPGLHSHGVSSLVLVGKADPVVAGGQPQAWFLQGLSGTRTMLEFPGVGHLMNLPAIKIACLQRSEELCVVSGDEARARIVAAFLREPEGGRSFIEKTLQSAHDDELRMILGQYAAEISFVNQTSTQ